MKVAKLFLIIGVLVVVGGCNLIPIEVIEPMDVIVESSQELSQYNCALCDERIEQLEFMLKHADTPIEKEELVTIINQLKELKQANEELPKALEQLRRNLEQYAEKKE